MERQPKTKTAARQKDAPPRKRKTIEIEGKKGDKMRRRRRKTQYPDTKKNYTRADRKKSSKKKE